MIFELALVFLLLFSFDIGSLTGSSHKNLHCVLMVITSGANTLIYYESLEALGPFEMNMKSVLWNCVF